MKIFVWIGVLLIYLVSALSVFAAMKMAGYNPYVTVIICMILGVAPITLLAIWQGVILK